MFEIPITIRIGVTGHRELPEEILIRKSIKKVLSRIENTLENSPHKFSIISPLAEGADRLVTEEILDFKFHSSSKKSFLEVILPLEINEYVKDFETVQSEEEFKTFYERADSVNTIPDSTSRDDAYYKAGLYTVDNCDVLISIWNGKPAAGVGGTAQIMEYAKKNDKWIFWINSENGSITELNKNKTLEYYTIYNKEKLHPTEMKTSLNTHNNLFIYIAEKANLPLHFIDQLYTILLPQFVRADILAQKYQKHYNNAGSLVYILSAGAVATVTIQILFFPKIPQIIWLEVAEISIILLLIIISNKKDWHRKWIDYRFLAERLRTALFFKIANIQCEITSPPPHLKVSNEPQNWIVRAYESICMENPSSTEPIPFEPFKKFLLNSWINEQLKYYKISAQKNHKNHIIFSRLGEFFFALTLVVASIHALNIEIVPNSSSILPATAIILPAIAAAITGIKINRDYSRNAKRYQQMAVYISEISERMEKIENMKSLVELLDEFNKMMLGENQDWRVVVQFHKLEPP
jgi:hypothetical protein